MSSLTLKKPVSFLGKTYTELNFSEPTGITIAECGVPFRSAGIDGDRSGRVDAMAVRLLAAKMADVPQEVIDMLKASDFMAVTAEVVGFFGDGEAAKTSSTLTSTSGDSGATSA